MGLAMRIDKTDYIIIVFVVLAVLFFVASAAYAGEKHHHIVNTPVIETTETVINNYSVNDGIASAIAAAQHQFNYGVLGWQGSVGIGAYDSKSAFSFGLAKRFNSTLINGNISNEEGKYGGGLGINWTF